MDEARRLLCRLQDVLDEAERAREPVPAVLVHTLSATATYAARLQGPGTFFAVKYQPVFPLLELPDGVISLVLSHLPALWLARGMSACRAFERFGQAAISMRLALLGQVLPTLKPREAATHALRFAELLSRAPPATLAAGESHTLFLSRDGLLRSCGGDFQDDDQETPFVGHLGHGEEWGEAVARPTAVRLPAAVRAHSVAAGGYVSLLLSQHGREAWSWGGYPHGHAADAGNVLLPTRMPTLAGEGIVRA